MLFVLFDKQGEDVFVEGVDGICSWKFWKIIKSKEFIKKFDMEYRGLYWGIDVLCVIWDIKGVWYLVCWKGGEWKNDWIYESIFILS